SSPSPSSLSPSSPFPVIPRSPIGVGKACLPALRTVRAVFPHTALQLLVSSSGVSRLLEGGAKGEQPMSSEEGIGPALVIGRASPDAGALLLLAQDGA